METARLRFRHPINPTSPFPRSPHLVACSPRSRFPLRRQVQGGPHPGPATDHPRADRSRSGGSSVCPLLTFNQQSPNYCSGRVRTSDVIAIFAFPLFSRSTVLGEKETDSWTRIFFLFEICTNWCVKYISVFNCIRKFFALEN